MDMQENESTETVCCELSHVMRKPVYTICEEQRHRSACAYAPLLFTA